MRYDPPKKVNGKRLRECAEEGRCVFTWFDSKQRAVVECVEAALICKSKKCKRYISYEQLEEPLCPTPGCGSDVAIWARFCANPEHRPEREDDLARLNHLRHKVLERGTQGISQKDFRWAWLRMYKENSDHPERFARLCAELLDMARRFTEPDINRFIHQQLRNYYPSRRDGRWHWLILLAGMSRSFWHDPGMKRYRVKREQRLSANISQGTKTGLQNSGKRRGPARNKK